MYARADKTGKENRRRRPGGGRALRLALEALQKPQAGQDDGGSEGHEEIERKHAGTIGPAVAQRVSLHRSHDGVVWLVYVNDV